MDRMKWNFKKQNTIHFILLDGNKKSLETIYISNKQFEDILRKLLLVKQYRVEIWKKSMLWTFLFKTAPRLAFYADNDGNFCAKKNSNIFFI